MSGNTFEIERKFLIKYPDTEILKNEHGAKESYIEQIYLKKTAERVNARIRKRVYEDFTEYTATNKKRISDIKRIEEERVITKQEYEALKAEADGELMPIIKKRIVLDYKGHIFEIDVYDFWSEVAFLEIELKCEEEEFEIPPFIEVLSELTHDRRFTNHSIAKEIPDIGEYINK